MNRQMKIAITAAREWNRRFVPNLNRKGALSMDIKTVVFAFIVAAVTYGCASTMDTDSNEAIQDTDTVQASGSETYDPDEVTCKRIAKTGSRFKTKVCATNAEWEASEEHAQNATEEMQRRPQAIRGAN